MNYKTLLYLIILAAFLAACAPNGGATPTATLPGLSGTSTAAANAPTEAPPPTSVPTPAQGRVVLVAPPEAGTAQAEAARSALAELAAAAKLAIETRPGLAAAEIPAGTRVIVFLQAPADLPALMSAAPQAQFLVVAGSELAASGNLSVIHQNETSRAFMAGYITTLAASDWRSVGLLPDAPAELQDAFLNGGRYWCGRCIPTSAPIVLFPLTATQPSGAAASGWQGAYSSLQKNLPQSVYVSPQANSPELLTALFNLRLILVGTQTPPAEVKSRWAATLNFDPIPALKKLWPDVISGKGGQAADAGLAWSDVNEAYFSAGKQRIAQETLAGLLDGTISPLSVSGN